MRQFIVEPTRRPAAIKLVRLLPRGVTSGSLLWLTALGLLRPDGSARAADQTTAQRNLSQAWQVTSYAKDALLSQQRVFDIAFTADGTVWLAAEDGLCRYDGFGWSLFGTNDGLPTPFMRAVCVDGEGRLWVGSDAGAGTWDFQRQKYNARGSQAGLANDNVREIDLDPDGTLWFSCDQWPETITQPGGLTARSPGQPGRWKTFHQTNGLPMDYVIGYFRDSTGRQFALTRHGWAQRQGERWGPPANPGYEAEDCVLQMAEARDGTLFAQGEHTLLTLTQGRWQNHPDGNTRLVCATKSGEVAAVEYNPGRGQLWFSFWNGAEFVRASAPVSCPAGARLYHLREAPDGSLWCVGAGTVVRWDLHAEKWSFYPQLPPPVGTDRQGRVWFADNASIMVYAGRQFQTLAPGKLQAWSAAGQAMIWEEGRNQLVVTDPDDPTRRSVVGTGCETIDAINPDTNGVFWILGQDKAGNGIVTRYDHGRTNVLASPEFRARQLTAGTPEPSGQLVVVAHERDNNRYGVARIDGDKVEWLPFAPAPPPLTYPNFMQGGGRRWLSGYSGHYEQSSTAADHWRQITAFPDTGFDSSLASPEELFLTFSGGPSGHAGCALFCSNKWIWVYGEFSHASFGPRHRTIYVPGRNGLFIRRQPGTLDFEFLQLPKDSLVNIAVADRTGTLWLGTSDGTFRYRPGKFPPNTLAVASADELPQGAPLPVSFRGQERFENANDPASFRYSWRVDQGAWSPFDPWPGASLKLPKLLPGRHRLEVRARDVDGNVGPTPAAVGFTILAKPLQSQPWFAPLVGLLAVLLAWLIWHSLANFRQIARTNAVLRQEITVRRQAESELERARGDLERRVIKRTEQLTRSNEQLRHQIAERRQAEERKLALEEQLHQSQKMEAIGTLAGGIAHDFNNILAIIIPYCIMLIEETEDRPDFQKKLREVLRAANRARDLVQQILTFSRHQQRQERRVCDLQPVVEEVLQLLRAALPSTLQMTRHIRPAHPVLANPTQIHQIIMNLCVNASHAMAGRQGLLEVGLEDVAVDGALCERHPDLRPGLYVQISVRDDGCGISQEKLKRIFEPFFTTRDVGQGAGLGLAVVHGIVQNHDGAILVQSQPGCGAEFRVLLPAHLGAVEVAPPPRPAPLPSHGGHILIVDDEKAIIEVLRQLLTRAGYTVTAYADPRAALQGITARPAEFQLIVSDLTTPGLSGLELAEGVYGVRPDLPLVITTGFAGDLVTPAQLASHPNIRRVVEKPLSPEQVLRLVAELLSPGVPV